ncbi:Gfo/Idh/MocA family protein [Planctomycetes bacterium K23_9]|uniref:Glucose--fructose oxidoreductase n=1 Tax=Stieleria marina TaxID=1930275 RepID=A0A517NRY8_9BACT|nr:Glucose--fructose oxidoreductase precursor [Planctomycetes bacterium K23_9]
MKHVRWGIIGTGDVAERKSGPAFYQVDRSKLVAVANRNVAKAKSFASRHGNPQVFDSVDEMLRCDEVDAVYIGTPPDSHCELTVQCAQAGKHVLCEKPMALSTSDCQTMNDACAQHGVSLSIAYYRRHFPVVQKIKQLLSEQAIGDPLRISVSTYSQFESDGDQPWRLNNAIAGGGFLMDVGTHRFDLMACFFGKPLSVQAITGTQTLAASVEDAASVAMEFPNGVQAVASFQWNSPVPRDTLEIVGTQGILWTDSLSDQGRLWLETPSGQEDWTLPAIAPVHGNLVREFVTHLLDGTPNPLSGESGSIATEISLACYNDNQ